MKRILFLFMLIVVATLSVPVKPLKAETTTRWWGAGSCLFGGDSCFRTPSDGLIRKEKI